jgi:hypothetical protein
VTVNVDPRSSSGFSVPARAPSASRATSVASSLTLRRLDGEAEVVAREVHDLLAVEPRVQLGKVVQRLAARLQHGRHEQLEFDAGEIALLHPRDRRHLAMRPCHVLRDQAAHAPDRLAPFSRTGRGA